MAAPAPVAFAPLVDAITAAFGGRVATVADLAPLATRAQVDALHQRMDALPAVIQAAIQAALEPHNAAGVAAAGAATAQAVAAARARNAYDRDDEAYAVVPRADGAAPAQWPPGLGRAALAACPMAAVDALLLEYQLLAAGSARARRNALAQHIGAARL
jgi:hypothetical protein